MKFINISQLKENNLKYLILMKKVEYRTQHNAEKSSEDEAVLSKRKHTQLMVLSKDDKENNI